MISNDLGWISHTVLLAITRNSWKIFLIFYGTSAIWKFMIFLYPSARVGKKVCLRFISICFFFCFRLLLKQLITMEVIQWTSLWNTFKDEFENENNMLGGSLGDKAAEDLRLRVIEHVIHYAAHLVLLLLMVSINSFFQLLFPCRTFLLSQNTTRG